MVAASKDCTLLILISDFGSMMQLLPKQTLVAYVIASHALIVDLLYKRSSRTLQKFASLVWEKSTMAAGHYKPTD